MNLKKSLLTFVIVLMASFAMAQTASQQQFYDRYDQIMDSEEPDTAAIHVLIEDWEKVSSDDPDLIRTKIIYELMQSDPSVPGEINQPFAERIKLLAEEAITRYPNRLDLRSYNAIGYFLVGQNEKALDCLLQIIDHSQTVNGNWLGKQNKPYEKGFE